jgi:hypothetical protein
MLPEQQELQADATRLALLPRADQEAVVAMYRNLAVNSLATPACRVQAKAKAAALAKCLRMQPQKARPNPSARPRRKR